MQRNKKKAFTLIELIAVLVILAVIALIVTPLVLNVVKKAKDSANKRSVDAYGKAVELAIATYLLDTGDYPTSLDNLTVEYSGNEVICNIKNLNEDGSIYLSECTEKGREVKDTKTDDGWYHYGERDLTNEEYVDNYGDELTIAVNDYIKTNGVKPTDLNSLILKYTSKKNVNCSIKEINYDRSIYLSECSVDNIDVKDTSTEDGWYHYGEKIVKTYSIGDQVTYNGMDFYVIADSDDASDSVTLLKSEPLTVDEINLYGAGRINRYTYSSIGTVYNSNGYGGMAYYSSQTCGYVDGFRVYDGCTTSYDSSDVKYAVDAWTTDKFNVNDLTEDSLGYKTRLITYDELFNSLDCSLDSCASSAYNSWLYNSKYWYWTMSLCKNFTLSVWDVYNNGTVYGAYVYHHYDGAVRPVVTLLKSSL